VGPLETNCYILSIDNKCLVIDPGDEYNKIKEVIGNNDVLGVIVTHYHFDHIGALDNFNKSLILDKNNLEEKEYNIDNLGSISHELGHARCHAILDNRSKRQLDDSFITYYEAYSHFMELCLFEYLKKNHIYLGDTLIDENYYYSRMKNYFEVLKTYEQIESTEKDNEAETPEEEYFTTEESDLSEE
jgi:hypothetical protein